MAIPLFQYQKTGAEWLAAGPRTLLLGDQMGLGKSATAISACDLIGAQHIVVVGPAIMRTVWAREFARFAALPRAVNVITDTKATLPKAGVTILSYEGASAPHLQKQLRDNGCDALILDEAHALKERDTLRTKSIYGTNCDGKDGIAQNARRIWALTGTPAPNDASELYPILRMSGLCAEGYWPFVRKFCTGYAGRFGFKITGNNTANVPELRALLSKLMLRRKRDEVLTQMPRLTISELSVAPTEVSNSQYILEEMAHRSAKLAPAIDHALETDDWSLAALKHVATVRRLIGCAKVKAIAKYIDQELAADPTSKIVVFGIHREALKYLCAYTAHHRPRILWGGSSHEKRQRHIDSFQSNHTRRVLLAQIKVAGAGITLTAANRIIILEPSWTPSDNLQAICRAYRIGQQRPVLAQFVSLAGSIDEAITSTLIRKTQVISALLD